VTVRGNNQTDSFYVQGCGAVPKPVFNPPIINFGKVPTGALSYQSTIITDTGDYPLYICDLQIIGDPEFTIAPVTPKAPFTVRDSGKGSQFVGINFLTNDKTGLMHYATLKIIYCDGTTDSVKLMAQEAKQSIQYASTKIDFGKVHVGTTKIDSAKYWNGMRADQTVGKIWTAPPGTTFIATTSTLTVKQTNYGYANVSFAPPWRGVFAAWHHSGGQDMTEDSIPLYGIGVAAVPVLSTNFHSFDTVDIGFNSKFTMSHADTGDWPLYAHVVKTLDPYNEFRAYINGKEVNRSADDTVEIAGIHFDSVIFAPSRPQLPYHEADLVFVFEDGSQQTVRFIGYDRSPFLAFDQDTIDFGTVPVCNGVVTQTVNIQNTFDRPLTASSITTPGLPFSASPSGSITVSGHSVTPLTVSFTPATSGPFLSRIVGGPGFSDTIGNIVIVKGTAAAPVPNLSTNTLDFGMLPNGSSQTLTFTIANTGNWPLEFKPSMFGLNTADFTGYLPTDTTIVEGGSVTYTITYLATTALQTSPRTAAIEFTSDCAPAFTLNLVGQDKPPLPIRVGFNKYSARAGDKVTAYLSLMDNIPDTMHIQHIRGTITYDSKVVDLAAPIKAGTLVPEPIWTTWTTTPTPVGGTFVMIEYDIQSSTDLLIQPGTLLKLVFKVNEKADSNASSDLRSLDTFPDSKFVVASPVQASIFVESQCGNIPLNADIPSATFIDQNSPNPFGSRDPVTKLPFDVGPDGATVTLRILDPTGREMFRPVDHEFFPQGRYAIPVRSSELGVGNYFYEFRANDEIRTIKKMTVE